MTTRRGFLAGGVGFAGTALAGCLGQGEVSQSETTTAGSVSVPADSPVSDVEVTATDVVVSLEPDTDVSQLNLIAPDGTAFARRTVTAGATTVRIPILDPDTRRIVNRYQPGEHEVFVVAGDETFRIPVELEPSLQITDATATLDEGTSEATGNITVEVTNTGSAPSWVSQIVYEGAPYEQANEPLFDKRFLPHLESPERPEETILAPGETKNYVGVRRPLQFPDPPEPNCSYGPLGFQLIVGTGYGDSLRANITVTTSGDAQGIWNRHICSEATVELEESQEAQWA